MARVYKAKKATPARVALRARGRKKHAAARAAYNALWKANRKQRTVPWADLDAIKVIYKDARDLSILTGIQFHVDHILPIMGSKVSGFHIASNLQIMEAHENMRKGNRTIC